MIYLCRHGETSWTKSGQHTGSSDIPLTSIGEEQARKLGKTLQTISFSKILSSPRKRALDTASIAGFDPEIDPDLSEWDYGSYEGKTSKEIGPNWNLFRDGAPNGESPSQVQTRADRLLKKLPPGPILLFSHGHFSRVIAARYLGLPVQSGELLFLSVASLSILGQEHSRPVIQLWNSTSHLSMGPLRNSAGWEK